MLQPWLLAAWPLLVDPEKPREVERLPGEAPGCQLPAVSSQLVPRSGGGGGQRQVQPAVAGQKPLPPPPLCVLALVSDLLGALVPCW